MKTTAWLAALLLCAPAFADTLDLTNGGSGTINDAIFQTDEVQPAGTGVIYSFVRVQTMSGNVTIEEGYNTDGRLGPPVSGPFDELTDPNFTRSITLGDIPLVTLDGTDYREFRLDVNEPTAKKKRDILLDRLKIFISASGDLTSTDLSDGGDLGDLIYDLDELGDNAILLDATYLGSPGSGTSDMLALIPDSLFPDDDSAFVTLYSYFGGANFESAEAGFEEWFVLQRPSPPDTNVSEPLLMVLLGYGLAVVGLRRRRRS